MDLNGLVTNDFGFLDFLPFFGYLINDSHDVKETTVKKLQLRN